MMRKFSVLFVAGVILAACGGTAGMPASVLPLAEIERLANEATVFAEQHIEAWPDLDAFLVEYTDDYTFADPTWADFRVGSEDVISMLKMYASMTDFHNDVTAEFVSVDGVALALSWPGLQPPLALPPDPPVPSGLSVYTFKDGRLASEELWYRASDNVAYGIGCFAVDDCPALQNTVDRYLQAWTSRDRTAISALYAQDATFSDSLLGLEATGSTAIGKLADTRFGSGEGLNIEVLDLYAWTDDTTPPNETHPEAGQLIGIAIHYRATLNGTTQEAITTLELGVRTNTKMTADPQGLIHREQIYHSPDTLITLQQDN